jgi:uncharacterized Zn-finger protein
MEANTILRLHNQPGVSQMRVGTKRFMCIGALPPFDHPHIFIDMGDDLQIVCPYCSTIFHYHPQLETACEPEECVFKPELASFSSAKSTVAEIVELGAPANYASLRNWRRIAAALAAMVRYHHLFLWYTVF